MKVRNSIPEAIITAAVAMLTPYVPDLSPTRLIKALQTYDNEGKEQDAINARPKRLFTLRDAMECLSISRPTIYRMQKRGEIKLLKIGNSTRVSAQEMDRILGN